MLSTTATATAATKSCQRLIARSKHATAHRRVLLHPASSAFQRHASSAASSTTGSSSSSGNSGRAYTYRYASILAASLAVGAAAFVSVQKSAPLLNDAAPLAAPRSALDRTDPLHVLSPEVLCQVRCHLDEISTVGLFKCWIVYASSSQAKLVEAGPWMLKQLEGLRANVPLVGDGVWRLFTICMKSTFYDTFVGGATVAECASLVDDYASKSVGVLLNYSAEASNDGSAATTGVNDLHIREAVNALISCAQLQANAAQVAESSSIKPTLLAIKLTGLVYEPKLLARATSALINSSSFLRGSETESTTLFPQAPDLSEEDHVELVKLYEGLREICSQAREGGVRILIDAEQSWYQPAIDRLVDLLCEEFNRPGPSLSTDPHSPSIPIVHNTYQCYTRAAQSAMTAALLRSERLGYSFGAKLVRGAYVEAERKRWSDAGEHGDCTIWDTKAQTDLAYDSCASILQERISKELKEGKEGERGTALFVASHNGTSVRKLLEALRRDRLAVNTADGLQIDERVRGRMSFAQLMGMSDNLTTTLTTLLVNPKKTGALEAPSVPFVVKAVPYATVDQALPYLIRRANENQSILQSDPTSGRGGAKGERKAVGQEIRRRLFPTFLTL